MRKMKKSLKIIITLVCVFAVAIASTVTAIIIHKNRKDKGDPTNPSTPSYALTASQIELGLEISGITASQVSANKLQPVEYSSKLDSVLTVDKISYLDESIAWSEPEQKRYVAYLLDSEGNPHELLTKVNDMNFATSGYYSSIIHFMGKNHFVVLYSYSNDEYEVVICSVEDHTIKLNKKYSIKDDGNYSRIGEEIFKSAFADDFFVITNEINSKYVYEFYDYLTDYSKYEPFTLEVIDIDDSIGCVGNVFKIDVENVAYRAGFGEFVLMQENEVSKTELKKAVIVETKTELQEKTSAAELVSGKYYSYSYKLVKGVEEKEISLGGLTKISNVIYSGEKYFGVFMKGVDNNNALNTNGTVVYFDYDLNVIAKYSAKSAYTGSIVYANEEALLTAEGLISGKNSADCIKIYDFANNNFEFVNILSNGEFVLKNNLDNLFIYNLDMNVALNKGFDRIVSFVDDDNIIFASGDEHFRYNIKTKAEPVKINYLDTDVSANTSVYFVKQQNDKFSLVCGSNVIKDEISSYSTGDNYLTYYVDAAKTTLYFVEKSSVSNVAAVGFTATANYGGSSGSADRIYSATPDPEESVFDQEPEWYEYDDKLVWEAKEAAEIPAGDPPTTTYKFTHCIQNGYFSKTNYVDYLEIHYNGEDTGNSAAYLPYRIYYRVDIVNGNPVLKILSRGHHRLSYEELPSGTSTNDSNYINIDGIWYNVNTEFSIRGANSGVPNTNYAYLGSYDYKSGPSGMEQYFYKYTDSVATADHTGLFLHLDEATYGADRLCGAEIYGNSIRVTIYFDFKYNSGFELKTGSGDYDFNQNKPIPSTEEADYYNDLYYQSVVVGIKDENANFYTDVIQMSDENLGGEAWADPIVNEYFVNTYLKGETYNAEYFNTELAYSSSNGSDLFNVCISSKKYITTGNDYQKLYLGGKLLKTNIVGAQIVGITSPKEFNHMNVTIDSLYETSKDSGSRNYIDEMVEFRVLPLGANSAKGEENVDSLIKQKYLYYDSALEMYSIDIQNQEYIYTPGGLNTYRYIYCVYEPQTFYVNVDYNASTDENSFSNETDYLQSYLGLSIGLDYRNDFVQYTKSWVYRNVEEEDFGDFDNRYDNKYYPYDFTNVETRQEVVDLTDKSTNEIKEIRKKNENSANIFEFVTEKERYFYIIIDGVKYYFQKNFYHETSNFKNPYSYLFEYFNTNDDYVFVAYKNIEDLDDVSNFDLFGKLKTVGTIKYYTLDEKYHEDDVDEFGIYAPNVDQIHIRVPKTTSADDSYVAYYHELNVHTRDDSKLVYDAYYSFEEDGDVIVPTNPDPNADYTISERFSFLYTDNILLTRLPQHTHYDFTGWKVKIKIDANNYLEYTIEMNELGVSGININTNLGLEHPFLAEYEEGLDGLKFFDLWRYFITDPTDNSQIPVWKNTIDNPIWVTAQWKPKDCDIKAVLYVKDGSKYNGIEYKFSTDTGYTLAKNFNIANNATTAPVFKQGAVNLDEKKEDGSSGSDGILDYSSKTQFKYGEYTNFAQIGTLMLNEGFSQALINTTGLSCQFIGWSFLNKDDTHIPIINKMDPRAETTLINEFIGDTTTITIYAFYTTSRYNLMMRFHPMGGATMSDGNKGYYSNYGYQGMDNQGEAGNDNIYNSVRNPAVYQILLKNAVGDTFQKAYCTGCGNPTHSHNQIDMTDKFYGVDIKDESNPFYVGDSVQIKIALNEQYYIKKVVFNNIVLRNDEYGNNPYISGNPLCVEYLDVFDLTFTYTYSASGGIWEGLAVSKIFGYTLPVSSTGSGEFKIGLGNQNELNNKISITEEVIDDVKYTSFNIKTLSYPGSMGGDYYWDREYDYYHQRLTGSDGFTMNIYPESYTIETEKITIEAYDKTDEKIERKSSFAYNNAMLISSQPLTNIEGKEPVINQSCYIWLGTSKYLFTDAWNTNKASGYYGMASDGVTTAWTEDSFTYEQFMKQKILANGNITVYYDSTEHRIYYPAKFTTVEDDKKVAYAKLTSSGHRYYFYIDEDLYYIVLSSGYNNDSLTPNASTPVYNLLPRYCLAHLDKTDTSLGNFDDSQYNDLEYQYTKGANTIAVYWTNEQFYSSGIIVYYKLRNISIGYNNTRVLAIDPDQERIYTSTNPTNSIHSSYYELNYYLSSITIGGTTVSFNKLGRDILTYHIDANGAVKMYGLLTSTPSVNIGSSFVRRENAPDGKSASIYSTNKTLMESVATDPNAKNPKYKVINFLGENYVIQDAYLMTISKENNKVGATDYYFYLTRNENGFTKYFIVYDEFTNNINSLKQNYSIKLTFRELNRNLTIVAEETDLYDANNRSFEISYADESKKYDPTASSLYRAGNYTFDYDNLYENIIADEDFEIDGNKFYEVGGNGVPFSSKDEEDIRGITSLKWQSTYEFNPSGNRRLKLSAKSGYLIKYIKVYVGNKEYVAPNGETVPENYKNYMTFEFIDDSLDDLFYYQTGGNYAFSSIKDNKLVSYIGYNINNNNPGSSGLQSNLAYGYKLLANETFGLYYSNFYDTAWRIGDKDTFFFDHLFLMLAGLYEDVKIEFATTSYTEFLFESGEADTDKHNPLIDNLTDTNLGDIVYDEIPITDTHLKVYTMKYDEDEEELVLDESLNENKYMGKDAGGNDVELPIFKTRYYFKNSVNNIKKNTIRLIFFGTGSKIKYGVHFIATNDSYSAYFTDGRYYNESRSSTGENAFENLESFSGRTALDAPISTEDLRDGTNKLVYMFTGELHKENASGSYEGFFKDTEYVIANESNFKFFMATTVHVNNIGVRTQSYLYNHALTSDSSLRSSVSYTGSTTITGVTTEEYEGKNIEYGANGEFELVLRQKSSPSDTNPQYYHYQLDTTHKRKSWFNDTVLSNIQFNSYLDDPTNLVPKTWVNREVLLPGSTNVPESELTRVVMGGLNFNWQYYEIPGYYLKYIMIKIADINSYFVVDISEIISRVSADEISDLGENESLLLKTIRIYNPNPPAGSTKNSYDYKFNLYYHKKLNYGYYQLYPVLLDEENENEIDIFNSVSLMSNDIYVNFISNAYNYRINYLNDDDMFDGSISTTNSLQVKNGTAAYMNYPTTGVFQDIYYDSMINLDVTQKMTGYTFVGWGSYTYYDNKYLRNRFDPSNSESEINIWHSQSAWYDPTIFFANAGGIDPDSNLTAEQSVELYLSLLSNYSGITYIPGNAAPSGAFYTTGGYFMSDTGFKSGTNSQNYNFFADYIDKFSMYMGHSLERSYDDPSTLNDRVFKLYGIWKANTYAIEFDVNNSKGDTVYVDYATKQFAYEFTSDKIGFRNIAKTEQEIKERITRLCYVVFDTNLWYSLSGKGDILMYSSRSDPYTITDLCDTSAVSKLAVDMFGYTWLGWSYTRRNDIKEGDSIDDPTRVFDSFFTNKKNSTTIQDMPLFNKAFMDIMIANGTVFEFDLRGETDTSKPNTQAFVYYGMHKATTGLNALNGYVCFYDYSSRKVNGNDALDYDDNAGVSLSYAQTLDFLNYFREDGTGEDALIKYSGTYKDPILLSYYDTFMSSSCYSIYKSGDNYSLVLTTNASDVRRIKLFANWSQNRYYVQFDRLDNSGYTTIYKQGTSVADNMPTFSGPYYFNHPTGTANLAVDLLNCTQPTRIGYDFLGWSFNYLPPVSGSIYQSLISSVNVPSQNLTLCKEMLAGYASLNGAAGTNELESNVLMMTNGRITGTAASNWILNKDGTAERLGDGINVGTGQLEGNRYIYLFPIWKAQTFSINISLNITASDLDNLHEKDSSFALGLFNSADESCKTFAGVNSNYYTYNKTNSNNSNVNDVSKYYYFYNDIVANVNFEIEFDQPFSSATCSFAGRTYYLKDIMMTSAGYYFMGLMAKNSYAGTKEYVVKNLMRSTLELNGVVHHEEDEDVLEQSSLYNNDSYLAYTEITGKNGVKNDMFDIQTYNVLTNSRFSVSGTSSTSLPLYNDGIEELNDTTYRDYVTYSDGYGTYHNSSNFGTLQFRSLIQGSSLAANAKLRRYNIMSEREGNEYYLFIIHNNVKYYVVYYENTGTGIMSFNDVITSDRTYLYYNVKDANGNVLNRYIIRFTTTGDAYYVDNTFAQRHYVTLRVALYTAKTNKLNLHIAGSVASIVIYSPTVSTVGNTRYGPNGSLTGGNNTSATGAIYLIGTGNYTLSNASSREFTLYADWELRQITSTIVNGNNATVQNADGSVSKQTKNSSSNPGLAGYYEMFDTDNNSNNATSSNNIENENRILLKYDFYSNIDHIFLPFYGGRYLSELAIEFDTLVEEGATASTVYRMMHNTIVIKFDWDNSKHLITISGITLNGITANNVHTSSDKGVYSLNTIKSIDILSFLDYRSLNDSYNDSGIRLYDDGETNIRFATSRNKNYINQVNVNLDKVMSAVKFTCKYSVQTYKVEVYTVVSDSEIVGGTTSFGSIEQMHLSSNYVTDNRGIYGPPYISNTDFSAGAIPTISTDCAKNLMSYNVPFYYFVTSDPVPSNATQAYNDGYDSYGLGYIYEGLYNKGTSSDRLGTTYKDLDKLIIGGYEFKDWYTDPDDRGSVVKLTAYYEGTPVVKNTVIYGLYERGDAPTKVLFYYWDNATGKYVQYTNNEKDYNSNTGDCIVPTEGGYKITKLPSPSIAPWYGDENKHFLGYIYVTDVILGQLGRKSVYEQYDNVDYRASNTFVETYGEIYSAFFMNKAGSSTHNSADSLFEQYGSGYGLSEFLSSRLVVHNNKYFTTTKPEQTDEYVNVNGHNVKVLRGARIEISVGPYKVYKDFEMLNVSTVIPEKATVHAIPLYEEYTLEIKDVFTYKNKATLTSNSNMIQSNVFETNAQYTIYYDPKDLKVAVSTSSSLNLSNIASATTKTMTFKDSSNLEYYDYTQCEFNAGNYVYVYYTKADGKSPFYMSAAKWVASGNVKVETKVDMYDSPLEVVLTGNYLETYRKAYSMIEDDTTITEPDVKANRKLVIYIVLQLAQLSNTYSGLLKSQVIKYPIYYDDTGSYPDSLDADDSNQYLIEQCIRTLNLRPLNLQGVEIEANRVASYVNYDQFSFFRLAYSLAYNFISKTKKNSLVGLENLYGDANMGTEFGDYVDNIITSVMGANTYSGNVIKPGDIMTSYRHNTPKTKKYIYNVTAGTYKTVYAYDDFNKEDIDAGAMFAMYLYKESNYVYVLDATLGIKAISLNDYSKTKYQEDDKYKKFYHGTHPDESVDYDNDKATGYYTLNIKLEVKENRFNGGYFYFEGKTEEEYIYHSSNYTYYYVATEFKNKWEDYQNKAKALDEWYDNQDAWTQYNKDKEAWDKNQELWAQYRIDKKAWDDNEAEWSEYRTLYGIYEEELRIWNGLTSEEKEGKTAPTPPPVPSKAQYAEPTKPPAEWAEPTKPKAKWTKPTVPSGYVRNSSSRESVAKNYVANNYASFGLKAYTITTSGQARYFSEVGKTGTVIFEKYFKYEAGREYYELTSPDSTADSNRIAESASAYGTGWDYFGSSDSNYWLIYNNDQRIYSRWLSFFS